MPRGNKGKARVGTAGSTKSDFTLYDFAHSAVAADKVGTRRTGRVKKGDSNAWSSEVKELCQSSTSDQAMSALVDDVAWYDRSLAEFSDNDEDEDECSPVTNEAGDGVTCVQAVRGGSARSRSLSTSHSKSAASHSCSSDVKRDNTTGGRIVYPIDLWFLIGRFVRPEDVGSFALICRGANVVSHSAQFWQRLYLRYYNPAVTLPPSLSPQTIGRVHGLKGRVVRALHYFYPAYMSRVSRLAQLDSYPDPSVNQTLVSLDCLEGAVCSLHWYVRVKQMWHFYWKLSRPGRYTCRQRRGSTGDPGEESLLSAPDVAHNKDTGCVVVQAVCPNFVPLPQVTGLILLKVITSAGHGIAGQGVAALSYARGHRVQLVFNTHFVRIKQMAGQYRNQSTDCNTVASIDPVLHIDIMHWWHPNYPSAHS